MIPSVRKSHFENLLEKIPTLPKMSVLDLGSGRGTFLVEAAQKVAAIVGLEPYQAYIDETYKKAEAVGLIVDVRQGVGEVLPFSDGSFDFVNMAEVIEHVENPHLVMQEVYRVLKVGGLVYISVPNRFGMKDQHFGLYVVNWLPRFFADTFISIFGNHKDYSGQAGRQRLSDMHYYTFSSAKKLFNKVGFLVSDTREKKIRQRFADTFLLKIVAVVCYRVIRVFYFDSFHFLLKKN